MKKYVKEKFIDSYRSNKNNLLNYVFYRTSDWPTAEDLTQEAFLKTWSYLKTGSGVDNLKKFLYAVTHNLLVDFYRQKEKRPIYVDIEVLKDKPDPKFLSLDKDIINRVLFEKYLKNLNEDYREILFRRYIQQQDIKQISEEMDYTPNHVSVILYRGGKKIKKKFQGL